MKIEELEAAERAATQRAPGLLHPRESWVWQGSAAHFICGPWCRFHLATVVGQWLVSTVGEYVSAYDTKMHGESAQPTTIGHKRLYETMVFRAGAACAEPECGGEYHADGQELDFAPANTRAEAYAAHRRLCELWATRPISWGVDAS